MKSREYYHSLLDAILDSAKINDIEDENENRSYPRSMLFMYNCLYQGYEIFIKDRSKGLIGSNTPQCFELFRILINHFIVPNGSEIKKIKEKETN